MPTLDPTPHVQQTEVLLTRFGSTEGGNYFLGGQYSLADVATSTLLHRAIILLKAARDIDVHAIIKEHKLDRCARGGAHRRLQAGRWGGGPRTGLAAP